MHVISDPEIAQEYELYKLALHAIRYKAITEAVQKVRKEREELNTVAAPKAVVRSLSLMERIRKNAMKIAAALIVVIGVSGLVGKYLSTTRPLSNKNITSLTNSASPVVLSPGTRWTRLIRQRAGLRSSPCSGRGEPRAVKDYFLTGMAYMEQKQYADALVLFNEVMTSNSKTHTQLFQDEAEYYAAMAYLATGQMVPARRLLDKMEADPDHLYHRQITEMSGLESLILRAK